MPTSTTPILRLLLQNPSKGQPVAPSDPAQWLAACGVGRRTAEYSRGEVVFSQSAAADSLYYLSKGAVILRVVSSSGKEAIVAILGAGDFFGEGCLTGQAFRTSSAVAMTDCSIVRLEKLRALQLIRDAPVVSELFLRFLLSRNRRMEDNLVDQLFNSSEKRLARLLLQLAKYHREDRPEGVIPKLSQETLAEIVGTTRPRVSRFMNRFRKLGLIDYTDHSDSLKIRSTLGTVVLGDESIPASSLAQC